MEKMVAKSPYPLKGEMWKIIAKNNANKKEGCVTPTAVANPVGG
jgi:hypothetical protein